MKRKKKVSMRARYPQARGRKPAKASDSTERVRRYRKRKRDQGLRQHIAWVPFSGLSKIGTEKIKRKASMVPRKKWKHASAAQKRGSKIRGSF